MFLIGACTPGASPVEGEPVKIRFAALRVLDSLPIYVAEAQGYFDARGLEVEILPVGSAPERDQLIASGQADGMINEVMSTLFANRESLQVQIVRICRAATSDSPVFAILAGKESGVTDLESLKNTEIGISQGTIIEYVTDRLLEAEGFVSEDFPKVNIPAIPDRLALLNSGELGAGTLPEPAATIALQAGAQVIINDAAYPEYGYSTIAFRKAFLDSNPEAVRQFLAAFEQAVMDINTDPGAWNSLLIEQEMVPAPLAGNYPVPSFPTAGVPTEAQFADAVAWANAKGLLSGEPAYGETILTEYLP
jgi:NitT/TauT family transport system substrate-binding protein